LNFCNYESNFLCASEGVVKKGKSYIFVISEVAYLHSCIVAYLAKILKFQKFDLILQRKRRATTARAAEAKESNTPMSTPAVADPESGGEVGGTVEGGMEEGGRAAPS
jgi:predicted alpha/beta-hydrolase family hydrolase